MPVCLSVASYALSFWPVLIIGFAVWVACELIEYTYAFDNVRRRFYKISYTAIGGWASYVLPIFVRPSSESAGYVMVAVDLVTSIGMFALVLWLTPKLVFAVLDRLL